MITRKAGIAVIIGVATMSLMTMGQQEPQQASAQFVGTFICNDVRYDSSTESEGILAKIPKDWKLVAVSNGEKSNSNNVWFQAASGEVYLLTGFTSHGRFIVDIPAQKLNTE